MAALQWLTFISATLAAAFQGRRAVQGWLYDQRDRRELKRVQRSGWSRGGVNTWTVRLDEAAGQADPFERTATLSLTVCGKNGEPSPDQADNLRRYLEEHQHLSRNPTSDELAVLDEATEESRGLAFRRARRRRLTDRPSPE